jgi:hypothetical protein
MKRPQATDYAIRTSILAPEVSLHTCPNTSKSRRQLAFCCPKTLSLFNLCTPDVFDWGQVGMWGANGWQGRDGIHFLILRLREFVLRLG